MGAVKNMFMDMQEAAASERYTGIDMELENIRFAAENIKRHAARIGDVTITAYANSAIRHVDNIKTHESGKEDNQAGAGAKVLPISRSEEDRE